MLKYRGARLIRAGFIGAVLMVLVIAVGLSPNSWCERATSVRYQALFTEAGGLATGNDVTMSGDQGRQRVGDVAAARRRSGDVHRRRGKCSSDPDSTAHIRTGSLLGQRVLTVESAGGGTLTSDERHPGVAHLVALFADRRGQRPDQQHRGHRHRALNQSLDTLSATLDQIAPQLGPTFDALTRLSQILNRRNQTLGELLKSAADVTGILGAAQSATQHVDPQRQRPAVHAGGASAGDRAAAGQHLRGGPAADRRGARQRGEAGADAGKAELRDRDAGEEPRQPRPRRCPALAKYRADTRARPFPTGSTTTRSSRTNSRCSSSSRSSTTRSASVPTAPPVSHRTTPGRAHCFHGRTTWIPGGSR